MRFRRRTKLFPGVYLNFSKSGISTTIGVRGATISLGKQGTYLNTSLPGTGIYDRQKIGAGKKGEQQTRSESDNSPADKDPNELTGAIKTDKAEATTSEGLQELKKTLQECYQERNEIKKEIEVAKSKLTFATVLLTFSYILIFGLFIKWFRVNRKDKKEYLEDLKAQLENCFVNIDMDVQDQFEEKYLALVEDYRTLLSCEKIWDITSSVEVDQKATRSVASKAVTRLLVKFGFGNLDIIKSKYDALHFENANGGDLYVYPAFVAVVDSHKKFGLVDIRDLGFGFQEQRLIETETVPKDASVVDKTWAKVNKNGTPDKRYKDNYEIPICQYGRIELTSTTGLNEAYSLSNYEKSEKFAEAMLAYQSILK